jgi:hypothetical protein
VKRERRWVISARTRERDPLGEPTVSRVVSSRAEVRDAMDGVEADVRSLAAS